MHIKRNIAAVLAAAAIAFPALAEGHENKTGFYAAPEIGRVKLKDYCGSIPSCEDSEIGYGLTAGYQFNEYFAVEAGGRFASGFDVSAVRRAPDGRGGFLTSTTKFDSKVRTFNFGGRATMPLGEHFYVTGKAGVHFWKLKTSGGGASFSEDGTKPYFGAGVGYDFNEKIGLRAEYTRYKGDIVDGDFFGANLVFRF